MAGLFFRRPCLLFWGHFTAIDAIMDVHPEIELFDVGGVEREVREVEAALFRLGIVTIKTVAFEVGFREGSAASGCEEKAEKDEGKGAHLFGIAFGDWDCGEHSG